MAPKLERATTGDYVACLLLPFWGLVIGLVAVIRGERRRGATMMLVGGIWLAIIITLKLSS